jgi:hypothetical protein
MKKKLFVKKIIRIEVIGFLTVIFASWLDEIFDLPHILLGASPTPFNYFESILETTLISVIAIIIIFTTHKLLQRLSFLEGILPVCSFCKKIRVNKQWVQIERYIRDRSEADFSHSICPECAKQNYGVKFGESKDVSS